MDNINNTIYEFEGLTNRISAGQFVGSKDEEILKNVLSLLNKEVEQPQSYDYFYSYTASFRHGGFAGGTGWLKREVRLTADNAKEALDIVIANIKKEYDWGTNVNIVITVLNRL